MSEHDAAVAFHLAQKAEEHSPENAMLLITSSAVFAAEAHAGQLRKELNEPYIVHPLRCGKMAAALGLPATFIAAMHLHDVVEDTPVPMATITALFPESTVDLVEALTKWWADGQDSHMTVKANKDAYYHRIMRTPGAVLAKVIDRIDNLHDFARCARMSPSTHQWAKKYHAKTVMEFSVLIPALGSDAEPDVVNRVRKMFDAALSGLEVAL